VFFKEGVQVQHEALLGRVTDPLYDRLVLWLRNEAVASRRGRVTQEQGLANGAYMVSEEWPSQAAYLEFVHYRITLEGMLYTEGASSGGEP
jgi:hypothetical protein